MPEVQREEEHVMLRDTTSGAVISCTDKKNSKIGETSRRYYLHSCKQEDAYLQL
jgi:hypothetical protein